VLCFLIVIFTIWMHRMRNSTKNVNSLKSKKHSVNSSESDFACIGERSSPNNAFGSLVD